MRAVWYDTRSADWRWKVLTSRRDPDAGWSVPVQLTHRGNNTFPSIGDGYVVFTTDRDAARIQRDGTQRVHLARPATVHR